MSRRRTPRWDGLLPVNKEAGPTSHDVVDMARKALGERRIGHTGTLDPMAEGLLLLCVGRATRLQQYLLNWDKTYHGLVQLGHATTTYDSEGAPSEPAGELPEIDGDTLQQLTHRFSGTIMQVPPPFSAKRVAGKKLYELARSGETVTVDPKQVTVHGLSITQSAEDRLAVEVRTSSGFYVRSLAHDLGHELGCGGHLHHLRRICIGPYTLEHAVPQKALESAASPQDILEGGKWVPISSIELPYPKITLNPGAADRFVHGQEVIVLKGISEPLEAEALVTVSDHNRTLLGIGKVQNVLARGRTLNIRPAMVLETAAAGRK